MPRRFRSVYNSTATPVGEVPNEALEIDSGEDGFDMATPTTAEAAIQGIADQTFICFPLEAPLFEQCSAQQTPLNESTCPIASYPLLGTVFDVSSNSFLALID